MENGNNGVNFELTDCKCVIVKINFTKHAKLIFGVITSLIYNVAANLYQLHIKNNIHMLGTIIHFALSKCVTLWTKSRRSMRWSTNYYIKLALEEIYF